MSTENSMREIYLEKLVINIGVGDAGERLEKAEAVIKMLTGQTPVRTISKTTNKDLGIRKGMGIGCKVTLRGEKADAFLKDVLYVRENRVYPESIAENGTLCFGIPDFTDLPGMKYDPNIGVYGMDIAATIKRKGGKRVERRKICRRKSGNNHKISREEATGFFIERYSLEVIS